MKEVCNECETKIECGENHFCVLHHEEIDTSENLEVSPGLEKVETSTPENIAVQRTNLNSPVHLIDTCENCKFEIVNPSDYFAHFKKTGHALFTTFGGKEMKFD